MARTPRNINFCIFVECYYLDGELCTSEECIFSKKAQNWWEWSLIRGFDIRSSPPTGKHRLYNLWISENGNLEGEWENIPQS